MARFRLLLVNEFKLFRTAIPIHLVAIFQPTVNGVLGSADFTGWLPGIYEVRLVVVDSTSNEVGACTIRLEVAN